MRTGRTRRGAWGYHGGTWGDAAVGGRSEARPARSPEKAGRASCTLPGSVFGQVFG